MRPSPRQLHTSLLQLWNAPQTPNNFDSYLDDSPWKKGLRNDSTIQAGYFRTPEGNFMWGVPANGMVRLNNGRLMPARGNQLLQEP